MPIVRITDPATGSVINQTVTYRESEILIQARIKKIKEAMPDVQVEYLGSVWLVDADTEHDDSAAFEGPVKQVITVQVFTDEDNWNQVDIISPRSNSPLIINLNGEQIYHE